MIKYDKLSIVPVSNRRIQRFMIAVILFGYVIVAVFGFWAGINQSRLQLNKAMVENGLLKEKNILISAEAAQSKAQSAKLDQDLKVERQTIELLRRENIELQQSVAGLEELVSFYKRVVKPSKDAQSMAFGMLLLEAAGGRVFRMQLDLMQIQGRNKVKGKLYVSIKGYFVGNEREDATLTLGELTGEKDKRGLDIAFKNFQSIDVSFPLVENFVPRQLLAKAVFTKGKRVTIEKAYDWRVKERS